MIIAAFALAARYEVFIVLVAETWKGFLSTETKEILNRVRKSVSGS